MSNESQDSFFSVDSDQLDQLAKLAAAGNEVASLVASYLKTPYPANPAGFQTAIRDAGCKLAAMYDSSFYSQPILSPYRGSFSSNYRAPYSRLLDQAGVVGQIWPGEFMGIPNYPGPLASMLVLGALGAGTGQLTGKAIDKLRGEEDPGLRRRLAIAGGILGTLPGAVMIGMNRGAGKHWLTGNTHALESFRSKSSAMKTAYAIPVERVHEMLWEDPSVAQRIPVSIAAGTSALVEGASRTSMDPDGLPIVTPNDIGRIAAGMGTGYLSGLAVGKVLGGLFGVSDRSQRILRQSGAAAGLLRAVFPAT